MEVRLGMVGPDTYEVRPVGEASADPQIVIDGRFEMVLGKVTSRGVKGPVEDLEFASPNQCHFDLRHLEGLLAGHLMRHEKYEVDVNITIRPKK